MPRLNRTQARAAIAARTPFTSHSGNMRGTTLLDGFGRLPDLYRPLIARAEYIVYSWETPIGWYRNGTWTRPDVKYSPTTSRHQGMVPRQ